MVGGRAVGPKCAKKAGLLPATSGQRRNTVIFQRERRTKAKDEHTPDLFDKPV